jgi:putative salt-induced outer membrane protein YdiY
MLEYIPQFEDFGDYLLAAEVGFEVPLSPKISWRTAVRDTYDSSPAAGRDENDLTLLTGISYSLGASAAPNKCKVCSATEASKPGAPPPQGTWITTGSLGFSLTNGNSDTLLLQAGLDTVRYTDADEIRLGIGGGYGEIGDSTNVENFRAGAQYNMVIAAPWYAGVRGDFLYDQISQIDYRVTPAAVLGAYLIKTDKTKLSIEAGPGGTFQKQGGIEDSFFSVIAQQRLEVAINGRTKFWQSAGGLLNTSDTGDYIISTEVGLDMKLSGCVSLRVMAQDLYDAQPAAGTDSNELRVTSGLAINF